VARCGIYSKRYPQARGEQYFWRGVHVENAVFSGGPHLLMELEAISVETSLNANIYCDKLEEITDLEIFLIGSAGH